MIRHKKRLRSTGVRIEPSIQKGFVYYRKSYRFFQWLDKELNS